MTFILKAISQGDRIISRLLIKDDKTGKIFGFFTCQKRLDNIFIQNALLKSQKGYILLSTQKDIMGIILYDIDKTIESIEINLLCGCEDGIGIGKILLNKIKDEANYLKYDCRLNAVPDKVEYYKYNGFQIEDILKDQYRMCIIHPKSIKIDQIKIDNITIKDEYLNYVESCIMNGEIALSKKVYLSMK